MAVGTDHICTSLTFLAFFFTIVKDRTLLNYLFDISRGTEKYYD